MKLKRRKLSLRGSTPDQKGDRSARPARLPATMALRIIPFALNLLLLAYLQASFNIFGYLAPDRLADTITAVNTWGADAGLGIAAAVVVVGAFAFLFSIPVLLTIAACVVLYGWLGGAVLLILIVTLGLSLMHGVAQLLGRPLLQRYFGGGLQAVDDRLGRNGLLSVIAIRLVFYFNPVANWALCLSSVGIRDVILGTLIGAAPMSAVQIWFVTLLVTIASSHQVIDFSESPSLFIRIILAIGLILALRIWWPRRMERKRRLNAESPSSSESR